MKPLILEEIKRDDRGNWTDPWQREMPRVFHTAAARHLFTEALKHGILTYYEELGCFYKGANITLAQLAYWSMKASTYLGLDRGSTHSQKPFEKVFALPPKALTRARGPLQLEYNQEGQITSKNEKLCGPIDAFFAELETGLNTDNNQ